MAVESGFAAVMGMVMTLMSVCYRWRRPCRHLALMITSGCYPQQPPGLGPVASYRRAWRETFADNGRCKSNKSFHRVRRGERWLRPRSFRRWGLWSRILILSWSCFFLGCCHFIHGSQTRDYFLDCLPITRTSRTTTATPMAAQTHIPPLDHPPIHPPTWFILFMFHCSLLSRVAQCWRPAGSVFENQPHRDRRGYHPEIVPGRATLLWGVTLPAA